MADDAWNMLMAMEILEAHAEALRNSRLSTGYMEARPVIGSWNGRGQWLRDLGFIPGVKDGSGGICLVWNNTEIQVAVRLFNCSKRPCMAWIRKPEMAVGDILARMMWSLVDLLGDIRTKADVWGIKDKVCKGRNWECRSDDPAEAITGALAKFIKAVYIGRDMIMKEYRLERWPS